MAEFQNAFKRTIKHEGGYANVSGDAGGETYKGIARKFHPNWAGWKIIDKEKPLRHNQKIDSTELDSQVRQFYNYNFWLPIAGDFLEKQEVADFLFDWHVNSGKAGVKALQKALGLKADGVIGQVSIEALNNTNLQTLKDARIEFYRAIVAAKPSQGKFLNAWLARANSY